jgi:hypothetical protein
VALPKWIREWALWLGAPGSGDYRRLAKPWREWSLQIRRANDIMRARAAQGRDRIAEMRVPARFEADHERLAKLLEPTTEGPQEDRLRIAVERRAEAQGLADRMQASARSDEEHLYTRAVVEELARRHADSIAMYDEWERQTQHFQKQLAGMSLPADYAELRSHLTDALEEFLGQVVRQRAALQERDYIKLGQEAVEWASVNARLAQMREQLLEKSPVKKGD